MTRYINKDDALDTLEKIRQKKLHCQCSREVIMQADALNYAKAVVAKVENADVIPVEWLEDWGRRSDNENVVQVILNDWRYDIAL